MGQYFKVVNPAKREYINAVGGAKAVELCSGETGKLLAYLVLEGPQDGTAFIYRNADPKEVIQEDREKEENQDIITGKPKDDQTIAELEEARKEISEANEYVGRWAGDPIVVVGDYSNSKDLVPKELEGELYKKMLEHQKEREELDNETARQYAEQHCNLYNCASEFFKDITKGVKREFSNFMGDNYEESKSMFRPDAVLKA